jgi:DNA-binding XRE family transcriptional regulator
MELREITADQSKSARTALGISQAFTAKTAGINRSQLAFFEVGKYQREPFKLAALRRCYEQLGYSFSNAPLPVAPVEVADVAAAQKLTPVG